MGRSALQVIQDKLGLGNTTDNATNVLLGIRVQRAKADILDGTTTAVFTVAGGEVLLTALYGIIQDGAHGAVGNNTNFKNNVTSGSDSDLCANLDLNAKEQFSVISVAGPPGTALGIASAGAVPAMTTPQIVPPGSIEIVSAGDGGAANSATLELNLWYFPLDDGATVVAA